MSASRYPWFRLYTESRNDAKLDALTDREFRIWHRLLCLSAEKEPRGVVDYIDPEFVAIELRISVDELDAAISRMQRLRLLERSDERVMFKAFEARQYDKPSDAPSATRERKRKQRQASVTPESRDGHAKSRIYTETEEDTETDIKTSPCRSKPVDNLPPDVLGYFEDKLGREITESDANSLRSIVKSCGPAATKLAIGQAIVQGESPDNFALVTTIARAECAS